MAFLLSTTIEGRERKPCPQMIRQASSTASSEDDQTQTEDTSLQYEKKLIISNMIAFVQHLTLSVSILRVKTQLQVVRFRFKTIIALHTSTLSNLYNQYDTLMCKTHDAAYFNSLVFRTGMQGALIYNKMFEKGNGGVVQMKTKATKKKFSKAKTKFSSTHDDEEDDDEIRMKSLLNDEDEIGTSTAFHASSTCRGALQIGISLLVLSPAINILLVAFLPLWLALFCTLVPIAIITEVLGVLALAILQSFDPFFEKQMKLSIERDERLLRASRL